MGQLRHPHSSHEVPDRQARRVECFFTNIVVGAYGKKAVRKLWNCVLHSGMSIHPTRLHPRRPLVFGNVASQLD